MGLLHEELTNKIIGCFYQTYNEIGYGFNDKVCANALRVQLMEDNISVIPGLLATVFYHGQTIGTFVAHLCVEKKIIVMVGAEEKIFPKEESKLLNYLKASEYEVGLLVNYGPEPSFIRKVYENKNKHRPKGKND